MAEGRIVGGRGEGADGGRARQLYHRVRFQRKWGRKGRVKTEEESAEQSIYSEIFEESYSN